MKHLRKSLFLLIFSLIFLTTQNSFAQSNASFEELMESARAAYEAKNFRRSIVLLLAANRKKPTSRLLYNVAKTYSEMNDCGQAIVYYRAFLREKSSHKKLAKLARKAVKKSKDCGNYTPDLSGRLLIKSSPLGAKVSIDNEDLGITPVEVAGFIAGKHTLVYTLKGHKTLKHKIRLEVDSDYSEFVRLKKGNASESEVKGEEREELKEDEKSDDFDLSEDITKNNSESKSSKNPSSEDKRKKVEKKSKGNFWSLGILFGGSYNQINRPKDAKGQPTLMFGSAYKGFGFMGGITTTYDVVQTGPGAISLRLDVLYAMNEASGFAHNKTKNYRRELTFKEVSVRAPVLLGFTFKSTSSRFSLFGGADLVLASLKTESIITQDNGVKPEPINTRGPTFLSLLGVLGYSYQMGSWSIPLDLRFNFNPFTQLSTRTRFDNYQSETSPGAYQVAFDWQAMATIGFSRVF